MKTLLIASLSAAALWLNGAPQAVAQEPVSTGVVQGVAPKTGVLTIRSNQTQRPVTFYGIDKATITAGQRPALITDIQPGMLVTVQYAIRGDKWYISKLLLPENTVSSLAPATVTVPVAVDPALRTPAARDDDRTTQPGSKAAVDGDITTTPAGRAAVDDDRTTKPTGNAAAATDGDRTTRPGSEGGVPLRRTAP